MRRWLIFFVILLVGATSPPASQARQGAGDDCVSSIMESVNRAGLPLEETAEIFGCRRLPYGEWTTATVLDPRGFRQTIPEEYEAAVKERRFALREDLRRMMDDQRFTRWFTYDIDTGLFTAPGLTTGIEMAKGNVYTTSLRGQPLMETPYQLTGIWDEYEQAGASYLLEPRQADLGSYVLWYMNRRDAAVLALTADTNPLAAQGAGSAWGYGHLPWPWQLADTYTINSYLLWQIQTQGRPVAPVPIMTPTSPSSSTAACPELGTWLGETAQRYRAAVVAIEAVGLYPFPDPEAVAQFGRNAAELERLTTEQEASDSPAGGLALDAVLIRALETYRDSFEVLTEAYRTGDQATSSEGWALRAEAQGYWGEAGRLLHDLEAECRAGGPSTTANSSIPTTGQTIGIEGQTYTSPQFGYVVTWQSPWVPTTATSDPETGDHLRLGTGDVAMEYHAFSTDQPVEQALEDFVAERARTHPGATPRYQAPHRGGNSDSPALWSFDYTRADGVVMGETTTAFSVGSGEAVLMRTVSRPENDESPRALFYAVSLVLDPIDATTVAQ